MIELTRFQQLRPVQKIAPEDTRQLGLPLYPDDALSDLANAVRAADTSSAYASQVSRYRETNRDRELSDLKTVHPVVASLYNWMTFKARPIRLADFTAFVATLPADRPLDLDAEWRRYADNLVVAIAREVLHVNYCVDFQLLIRICYLIRRCLTAGARYTVDPSVTAELVNEILGLPILLPSRIVIARCREHCDQRNKMELPKAPAALVAGERNPCECRCDESCQKPSGFCLCIRPYIGDLFVIKESLARFEEGDIADIENILAGEKKTRRHRTLLHSETSTESETETVTSEERDHEVNEKFSLQSEVKSTVDEKLNVDAGVTATLKYGDAVTITPHANVTANLAKSESQSIARSYAKDVVDRAVSKVQEKVRKLQISKVVSEVEEKNLHSIDNTQAGADHRAGIYYWVNKISHAQVYNYGKHMMFDVIVPEPAAMFKKLYEMKLQSDKNAKAPAKPPITPQSIQRNTYGGLLNQYGIATTDEIQPPSPTICVQVAFSQNVAEPDGDKTVGFSSNEFKTPDIPKGYHASAMDYDIRVSTGHPGSTGPDDQVAVSVNVGDACLMIDTLNEFLSGGGQSNKNWSATGHRAMKGETGSVTVAVAGFSTLALSMSGTIAVTCALTDEAFEKWQTQIYNLIMTDYNRKLDAYNAATNRDEQLFQIKGRNPFLNREIERNEFKRNIIAVLMCNYFNGIGSMMSKVAPCGYPEIDFARLEKDAPVIQFFEQVFEWQYMTYLFYHSMWARKCKWADLIDEDSGDPLFDKFLMSGAARVQVPVRRGLEDVFSWFLKTGQIWGATGQPPVAGDDDYVAMIQELKEADQCDYSDRPGLIAAVQGSDTLVLTKSTFYWDLVNDQPATLALDNDVDREILVNFKVYRIVAIEQAAPGDITTWNITIDQPYPDASATNMKHAVGAVFVGAPWEIVVPTSLVYLRNPTDKLPTYPLS